MRKGERRQFCKYGHDTFIVGRKFAGGCRACERERQSIRPKRFMTQEDKARLNAWRKANPQRIRESGHKYRHKSVVRERERQRSIARGTLKTLKQWANLNHEKVATASTQRVQSYIVNLDTWYLKLLLSRSLKINYADVPDELLELKREQIAALRLLKRYKEKATNENNQLTAAS